MPTPPECYNYWPAQTATQQAQTELIHTHDLRPTNFRFLLFFFLSFKPLEPDAGISKIKNKRVQRLTRRQMKCKGVDPIHSVLRGKMDTSYKWVIWLETIAIKRANVEIGNVPVSPAKRLDVLSLAGKRTHCRLNKKSSQSSLGLSLSSTV